MTDPISTDRSSSSVDYNITDQLAGSAQLKADNTEESDDNAKIEKKLDKLNVKFEQFTTMFADQPESENVLNKVINLIQKMLTILQRIGMAQATYLSELPTKMQALITNLITQVPYYVKDSPLDQIKEQYPDSDYKVEEKDGGIFVYGKNPPNKDKLVYTVTKATTQYGTLYTSPDGTKTYVQSDDNKRNDANQILGTYMESLRNQRDLWADQAKKMQSTINTTNESVNGQIDLLTSLFDKLRDITSKIFR